MKATVYIALTLDGYIATSDGSVDFLNHYQSSASKEDGDMGFSTFLNSVDLLIMGRKTWDQVISFGEEVWPYGDRKVWIWSREGSEEVHIPVVRRGQAEVVCMGPTEILKKAENEGFGHAYVDGGTTIKEFLRHDCIQEFVLTRVPLLLGSGIPLFASDGKSRLELEHLTTTPYSNGLVQSHYRIVKN